MTRLRDYVHGRSGDKGSSVTIGIIPYDRDDFDWLRVTITKDRVAEYLSPLVDGPVKREELVNLPGLVFLCQNALPGGGMGNLKTDAQGKTYFQALGKMPVKDPS